MCSTASVPYASEEDHRNLSNGIIKSNFPKTPLERMSTDGVGYNHCRTSYSRWISHKPRRTNSIAIIRSLWVHAEKGLDMKPFEPALIFHNEET